MEKCNFCESEVTRLEVSHIVPKFFYRWLKKGSTLKRMRSTTSKKPVQDGYKIHFLCKTCERDFAKYEKYFSEQIFIPFTKNNDLNILNDIDFKKFNKFVLSLLWRISKNSINNPKLNGNYKKEEIILFNNYTDIIKNAYHSSSEIPFNTYIIPLIKEFETNNILKVKDYVYYERSISIDFIIFDNNEGQASILVKLPFFLIACEFISSNKDIWKGLKINKSNFKIEPPFAIPKYIHDYMQFNCREGYQIIENLGEDVISSLIEKSKEKMSHDDDTYKALMKNSKI